jgi:hypothetical protein
MTTLANRTANQWNAQHSTGPKTDAGKAVARMNALAHGLRAAGPVIPGEEPVVWEAFRDAVVADLNPVGVFEQELADRVASLAWRLRRVARYEAGVADRGVDRAGRKVREDDEPGDPASGRRRGRKLPTAAVKLQIAALDRETEYYARLGRLLAAWASLANSAPVGGADAMDVLVALGHFLPGGEDGGILEGAADGLSEQAVNPFESDILAAAGVPAGHRDEPQGWGGWTAGAVRRGAARMGRAVGGDGRQMLALAATATADAVAFRRSQRAELVRELAATEAAAVAAEATARQRGLLPVRAVDAVVKYEGHLQRQLTQILHELERRQSQRSAFPTPPPVAVDVTVHAPDGLAALLAGGGV